MRSSFDCSTFTSGEAVSRYRTARFAPYPVVGDFCCGVGGDTINQLVAQRAADGVEVLDELDENLGELAESAQAPSVIKLVNELLIEALERLDLSWPPADFDVEAEKKRLDAC